MSTVHTIAAKSPWTYLAEMVPLRDERVLECELNADADVAGHECSRHALKDGGEIVDVWDGFTGADLSSKSALFVKNQTNS